MVFPVKVPYTVSTDISKFDGQVFNATPDPDYLIQKKRELERFGMDVAATEPEAGSLVQRLTGYTGLAASGDIRELAL